jgi:hypothetical protein
MGVAEDPNKIRKIVYGSGAQDPSNFLYFRHMYLPQLSSFTRISPPLPPSFSTSHLHPYFPSTDLLPETTFSFAQSKERTKIAKLVDLLPLEVKKRMSKKVHLIVNTSNTRLIFTQLLYLFRYNWKNHHNLSLTALVIF